MRKLIISTALGLGAFAGGAAVTAAYAQTTTPPTTGTTTAPTPAPDRGEHLKTALDPLVKDGTITEAQRDKVVDALKAAGPKGGRGGPGDGKGPFGGFFRGGAGPEEAAAVIGIDAATLRTELEGKTLAQVAEAHGKTRQQLIDGLVAAATKKIDQAVTDGKLTKEQADARKAELPTVIGKAVDATRAAKGDRPGGFGGRRGPGGGAPGSTTTTPSTTTP